MPSDPPDPLIPPGTNLRSFPFMPLDVTRLRDSDLVAVAPGEEFRADFETSLTIVGASEHNLAGIDVVVPLGALVAVTGVSGAGKSTLVHSVLVGNLVRGLPEGAATGSDGRNIERGAGERIEGLEHLDRVVVVGQSAVSRSPRSNPATVSKATFKGSCVHPRLSCLSTAATIRSSPMSRRSSWPTTTTARGCPNTRVSITGCP